MEPLSSAHVDNFKKESQKSMGGNELPPEFTRFDKPLFFNIPNYYFYYPVFGIAHVCILYTVVFIIGKASLLQWIAVSIVGYASGLGLTVGSHRYWTHRSFKANLPLRILLMLMQTSGDYGTIFAWVRDHRVHHKYTDTDADPHKSTKGLFFSHIGWLMQENHPDVTAAYRVIEISDLVKDPVLRFQSRYYFSLLFLTFFLIPMSIFHLVAPEWTLFELFAVNMTRFMVVIHAKQFVNSIAHRWGYKPYDKYISSVDNFGVNILTFGEGWHNFHHTFPWDYRSSEFGFNNSLSTTFINFFAWLGWASDLKVVNRKHLIDRINRTGDGSHASFSKSGDKQEKTAKDLSTSSSWGYGDKAMSEEDLLITETMYSKSL